MTRNSDWKIDHKRPTEIYVERTKLVTERICIAEFNYPEDAERALKAMRRGKHENHRRIRG